MTENRNSNKSKDKNWRASFSEKAQILEACKAQIFWLLGRVQWSLVQTPIMDEGTGQLGVLLGGHISWLQTSSGICTSELLSGADIAWKSLWSSEVTLLLLKASFKTDAQGWLPKSHQNWDQNEGFQHGRTRSTSEEREGRKSLLKSLYFFKCDFCH